MNTHINNSHGRKAAAARIIFAVLLLALCIPLQSRLLFPNARGMADDAMISARYARNVALGHGLRYNREPSQQKPVEGYSNFLWTMGLALGEKLRLHPRITTAAMGGASSLICVLALGFWVRYRAGSSVAGVLAALALASCLPFAVWAVQGLETPLFAALIFGAAAVALPERPRPWEYLLCLLACLCRPDGLIVAAAVIMVQLLHKGRDLKRLARVSGAFFLAPFIIYTAWRWHHFGALVPNVFYAKTGLGLGGVKAGVWYVLSWAKAQWPMALLLVAGVAPLFAGKSMREERKAVLIPGLLVLLYLAFVIAAGGDFMPDARFLMHVLPLIIGMGAAALAGAAKSSAPARRAVWVAAAVAVLGWNAKQIFGYEKSASFAKDWHRNQEIWYGRASSWLLRHGARSDVIACGDIGYIGYVTGVDRILDTNGLVDPYLAGRPGAAALDSDPDYVLAQKPRFIVVMVHYFEGGTVLGHSAFDRAVLGKDLLVKNYQLAVEEPGWKSVEKSFVDNKTRTSMVRFRIYERKDEQG